MGRVLVALCFVLALSAGYLTLRVIDLEQRVARLGRLLGEPAAAEQTSDQPTTTSAAPPSAHEQRISKLEAELRGLRDDLRTLEQATSAGFGPSESDPKQILSVVSQEAGRIRDRQLEFHRSHWLKTRKTALQDFVVRYGVNAEQASQLEELLTAEVDRLVAIMRRPDALENPEQMAADWSTALRDTDHAVHGVLDPPQVAQWDTVRGIERRILWPWLETQ